MEYVEDYSGPRTTQDVGASFAAVEQSISDSLLGDGAS